MNTTANSAKNKGRKGAGVKVSGLEEPLMSSYENINSSDITNQTHVFVNNVESDSIVMGSNGENKIPESMMSPQLTGENYSHSFIVQSTQPVTEDKVHHHHTEALDDQDANERDVSGHEASSVQLNLTFDSFHLNHQPSGKVMP